MCKESRKHVGVSVCLLLTSSSVWGIEWQLQRGFDIGLGYSDNVSFSRTDLAESGSTINLAPFVEVSAIGRESQFSLLAGTRYQSLPEQSSDSFVPELDANLSLELVEDMLATNIRALVTQVESNVETVFDDSIALSNDTNNQYLGSFNSNFNYNFGSFSNLEADHTYSLIENSGDVLSDSTNHTASLRLAELSREGQPDWGLEGRYQRTDFSGLDDSAELYSLIGEIGLFTSRDLLVTGLVGNEWINSGDDEVTSRDDIWSLTLAWRPNAQNSLELGYGERSFGSNPTLEYTLTGRRVTFSAHWRRNYANTRLVSSSVGVSDEGTTIPIVDQEPGAGVPEHLLVDSQRSVDDEFGMSFLLRGRLSDILLEGIYVVREDRVDQTEVRDALISASFNRRLNVNTSWEIRYSYREQQPDTAVESTFENRVQLILRYLK